MKNIKLYVLLFLVTLCSSFHINAQIFLKEIYFDPVGTDDEKEWIKLYNNSSVAVDISNYSIAWGIDVYGCGGYYTIPNGTTIEGNETIIIGGPNTTASATPDCYDLEHDFEGDLPNESFPGRVGAAVGIALFDAPPSIFNTPCPAEYFFNPLHQVVYNGGANSNGLPDENGNISPVYVSNAPEGSALIYNIGTDTWSTSTIFAFDNNCTACTIGAACDDGNPQTVDEVFDENCNCTGELCVMQLGDDIDGVGANDDFGESVTLSTDGSRLVSCGSEGAKIYEYISNNWTQIGSILNFSSSSNCGPTLGCEPIRSVSISSNGERVAIGASPDGAGIVAVYELVNSVWVQLGSDITGFNNEDIGEQERSISISSDGSRIAVGGRGVARVYELINSNWTQIGSDLNGNQSFDDFGTALSLSANGDRLAVGDEEFSGTGYVKVFDFTGSNWIQIGSTLMGDTSQDRFGASLDLTADGQSLVVGAPFFFDNTNASGYVKIFNLSSGDWTQVGNTISGEAVTDLSGAAVAISSNAQRVIVGAPANDGSGDNAGHVRIFNLEANQWIQDCTDIDGEMIGDRSGDAVALSNNGAVLAIGAQDNDGNGLGAGHVRVFEWKLDTCPHPDYTALEDFYNATNGETWTTNTDWLSDCDPCGELDGTPWHGITCDATFRIKQIVLQNNNVTGSLPLNIGDLDSLQILDLRDNGLGGILPVSLGDLSNLEFLQLQQNGGITDTIPSALGNLKKLKFLRLEGNQLTGGIPESIGMIDSLEFFGTSDNINLGGVIPTSLGNLSKLQFLYLRNCQLTGTLPTELGNLTQLQFFWADRNQLTGSIPASFGDLSSLQNLKLFTNDLSGCYPSEIGVLCSQLGVESTNANISDGNNFDATWEDFCLLAAGTCDVDCPQTLNLTMNPIQDSTYQAIDSIVSTVQIVGSPSLDITYKAGEVILLQVGFEVENGNTFQALIEDCNINLNESVIESRAQLAKSIKAYPNPFSTATTIEYELSETSEVEFHILDVTGRLVETLIPNQQQAKGKYRTEWLPKQQRTGVYLLRVRIGKEWKIQKLMLIE